MDKNRILLLGSLTVTLFPLVGILLLYFFNDANYHIMLRSTESFGTQMAVGIPVGLAFGLIAWMIADSRLLRRSTSRYLHLIGELKLNFLEILFLSLCAGIGEELFFRGVLQYYWGVVPTAVLFVAIHGYISFKDWKLSVYGFSMTILIIVLGYMCEYIGIWSAAIAHAMIDVVLFYKMNQKWNKRISAIT